MNFGFEYIFKETPIIVIRLKSAINYMAGTALIGSSILAEKTGLSPTEFSESLGLAIVFCNVILTMFGKDKEVIKN